MPPVYPADDYTAGYPEENDTIYNEQAEREALGTALQSHKAAMAVAELLDPVDPGADFYKPLHEMTFNVISDLYAAGKFGPQAVHEELTLRGARLPSNLYIADLFHAAPAVDDWGMASTEIVRGLAAKRRAVSMLAKTQQAIKTTRPEDLSEVLLKVNEELQALRRQTDGPTSPDTLNGANQFSGGGSFFHNVPENPEALWGEGGNVLWAKGEALMITAPQGCGKTTVAMQIVRARLGLQSSVLGFPVEVEQRKVLYLAMDRPSQAQRAGNRIFKEDARELLDEKLVIWKGPPAYDMAKNTDLLARMCAEHGAGTVIVDSLKDAAIGLSEDIVGAGWNRARQKAITEGVEVIELHHVRKAGNNGSEPDTLADVYGSTWLTSGTGSVISLYGEAGDPVVSLRHLKQPMNEVGPYRILHDHESGISTVMHGTDLLDLVRASGVGGLIASAAAVAMFETDKPTVAQIEKARRKLDKLRADGVLSRTDAPSKGAPAAYHLSHPEPS